MGSALLILLLPGGPSLHAMLGWRSVETLGPGWARHGRQGQACHCLHFSWTGRAGRLTSLSLSLSPLWDGASLKQHGEIEDPCWGRLYTRHCTHLPPHHAFAFLAASPQGNSLPIRDRRKEGGEGCHQHACLSLPSHHHTCHLSFSLCQTCLSFPHTWTSWGGRWTGSWHAPPVSSLLSPPRLTSSLDSWPGGMLLPSLLAWPAAAAALA